MSDYIVHIPSITSEAIVSQQMWQQQQQAEALQRRQGNDGVSQGGGGIGVGFKVERHSAATDNRGTRTVGASNLFGVKNNQG
jgi:hypothetical protein